MPHNRVAKTRGKAKRKLSEQRAVVQQRIMESYSEDLDVKMAVIQELIPLGLQAVAEQLQQEVKQLVGEKHHRVGANARWGRQNGSVYLRDQKFPLQVPRVRNLAANQEVPLAAYRRLQQPFDENRDVVRRLLHGLSTHKYQESSALAAEAFGLSASTLSKQFRRGSAQKLQHLQTRSLAGLDLVAIFLDAKRYAQDGVMVALGVTLEGTKLVLGVEQMHRENARAIDQWLGRLVERGLAFEQGILFIIDGSKGIKTALEQRFAPYGLIQRCQWHKRENVVAYLDKAQQVVCRRRLQAAYAKTTYAEAKTALTRLHHELEQLNVSAAHSLREGLEETLTVHRLGLATEVAQSLTTTNCIESLMAQLGSYTDKVDRWRNSDQILRWTATGLLDCEPRLRRIKGYGYLKVLRYKLQEIVAARLTKGPKPAVHDLVEAR